MDKLVPLSPDPYIRTDPDATLARFGHLNTVVDNLNDLIVVVDNLPLATQGPTGPQGNPGPTGPQGPTGVAGANGLNGQPGINGTQGPAGANGVPGDKFSTTSSTSLSIDLTSPKSMTIGTGLAYVAAQPIIVSYDGTNYINGIVQLYNPATGSLVFNVDSIVGSGSFNSWFVSLSGIQGPPGPTGLTGPIGATGATGANGLNGVNGTTGPIGPAGPTGPAGALGPVGPQGIKGDTGLQGPQGIPGLPGQTGATGAVGATGPAGANGAVGAQGPIGPIGPAGLVWKGTWNPTVSYVPNDAVSYNGASYFCIQAIPGNGGNPNPATDVTNWALLAAQGPQGPAGINGTNGTNGAVGATGPQGIPGIPGLIGPQGPQGDPGPPGPPGISGSGSASINQAIYWGAEGSGTGVLIKDAIDPLTNLPYGVGGLAAAQARWNLVKQPFSVDTINFSVLTAYPAGGTVQLVSGVQTLTCTFAITPPLTAVEAANEIAKQWNNGITNNNSLNLAVSCVGTTVTVYSKSTAALTVNLGVGTTASAPPSISRSATYQGTYINVNTDTVDWVALQQLLWLVEGPNAIETKVVEFQHGANYILSKPLFLPTKTGTGNSSYKAFAINGNNSMLQSLGGTRRKLISLFVPCQNYADGIQGNLPKFIFDKIAFKQPYKLTRDTNPLTQSAGLVVTGYQAEIKSCYFIGGDIGIDCQFGLQTHIQDCICENQNLFGIAIRTGQWFQAGLTNSQSNGTVVDTVKFRLQDQRLIGDGQAQYAAIYLAGSSDCDVRNIIFEGGVEGAVIERCYYGLVFDALYNNTVVKDFSLYNVHLEKSFQYYAFQIRAYGDSNNYIGKVTLIATQNFNKILDFGAGPVINASGVQDNMSGTPHAILERFPYKPTNGECFRNTSGAGIWRITDVMTDNSPQPLTGAQFIDGTNGPNIWDIAVATIPFYDGFYLSPSFNTIVNVTVNPVYPSNSRIIASNQN